MSNLRAERNIEPSTKQIAIIWRLALLRKYLHMQFALSAKKADTETKDWVSWEANEFSLLYSSTFLFCCLLLLLSICLTIFGVGLLLSMLITSTIVLHILCYIICSIFSHFIYFSRDNFQLQWHCEMKSREKCDVCESQHWVNMLMIMSVCVCTTTNSESILFARSNQFFCCCCLFAALFSG